MVRTDRFLLGIVAGALLLVAAALGVAMFRPAPSYLPDDTADHVAHNYLLALQREDYGRAYGYLSPSLDGYPRDVAAFSRAVRDQWSFQRGAATIQIERTDIQGAQALVRVRETRFVQGGLFSSGTSSDAFDMTLRQESGGWKLIDSDSYWAWCWDNLGGCD